MHRKNIILDTDIGPDCDDAAALAVLKTGGSAVSWAYRIVRRTHMVQGR